MIWRAKRNLIFLMGFVCCASACAQSPDHAREKRWAAEVTPGLVVGDAITLTQADGHRFLALHTANASARAGVVVVHGMGVHPDWNLIGVLRTGLAEGGYATLDRKSTRLNSSHIPLSRMPSSA